MNLNLYPIKNNIFSFNNSIKKSSNSNVSKSFDSYTSANLIDKLDFQISFKGNKNQIKTETKDKDNKTTEMILSKPAKITKQDYEKINIESPQVLKEFREYLNTKNIKHLLTPTIKSALLLKEYFNSTYGKNYTVISLGTSPAPISEIMSHLGVDVEFLPISGIKKAYDEGIIEPEEIYTVYKDNIDIAIAYLEDKLKKYDKNRKFLILDYTNKGTTLNYIKYYIEKLLHIPKDRLEKISIIHLLEKLSANNQKNALDSYELSELTKSMRKSQVESYSNVPHFYVDNSNGQRTDTIAIDYRKDKKENIFKKFDEYSTNLGKKFILCAMSELDKNNIPFKGKMKL